ncbi:MAG: molybdopterin converting factor subunit 1 [Candidatus Methylacidiphilales bacterium]
MKVLYFASARTAAGLGEETWQTDTPLSLEMFWQEAIRRHPNLAPLRPSTRLARNADYLQPGELLHPNDEVALIPPVSGG